MSRAAELRRDATRARIIEAARRLFSRLGYHNTQVMDIVQAVGMSAGTFYKHFRDKRELFEYLTTENVESLRHQMRLLREPLDAVDPEDRARRLRFCFEALFDLVDENPEGVLMLLRGSAGQRDPARAGAAEPEVAAGAGAAVDAWHTSLLFGRDLLEDAARWEAQGLAPMHPVTLFAHSVVGMSMQVLHSYLVERAFTREQAVDALVALTTAMLDTCFTHSRPLPDAGPPPRRGRRRTQP
jgi:AcrR family transcriptional regulator